MSESEIVAPLVPVQSPAIDVRQTNVLIPGQTLANVRTNAGAFTILLPFPAADENFVLVHDVDGNAAANPITVSGNGSLVDGAGSASITTDGALGCYLFDGGQWRRALPLRRFQPDFPYVRGVDVDAAVPPPIAGLSAVESNGTPVGGPFTILDFVDFPLVIDAGGGVARIGLTNTVALTQDAWFVDPIGGSDANTGLTALTAVQHFAEIVRRWGAANVIAPTSGTCIITLMGDLPITDPVVIRFNALAADAQIQVVGTRTVTRTSTFTAVTPVNRGPGGNAWEVEDLAFPVWPADGLHRIRVTGGPNAGAVAYPVVDQGASVARTTAPFSVPTDPVVPQPALMAFTAGDPYVIETLSHAYVDAIEFSGANATITARPSSVYIRELTCDGIFISANVTGGEAVLSGCMLQANLVPSPASTGEPLTVANCLLGPSGLFAEQGDMNIFAGGVLNGFVEVSDASRLILDGDFLAQGSPVLITNGAAVLVGLAASYDSPTDGFRIGVSANDTVEGGFCRLTVRPVQYGIAAIYGDGNTNVGVMIGVAAGMLYDIGGTILSCTGASGDVTLGGSLTARAWDEALGVYTTPILLSWATLATAIGFGLGFGGSAHNVQANAHILRDA